MQLHNNTHSFKCKYFYSRSVQNKHQTLKDKHIHMLLNEWGWNGTLCSRRTSKVFFNKTGKKKQIKRKINKTNKQIQVHGKLTREAGENK